MVASKDETYRGTKQYETEAEIRGTQTLFDAERKVRQYSIPVCDPYFFIFYISPNLDYFLNLTKVQPACVPTENVVGATVKVESETEILFQILDAVTNLFRNN